MALRHERRLLQKSEINLGREGIAQAANFPELRNEIVALKKLEQEQKEVALRIARFAGVLLQFVLFLRQSARSAERLLFAPAPVSLVQRSRCAARENSPPVLFPR